MLRPSERDGLKKMKYGFEERVGMITDRSTCQCTVSRIQEITEVTSEAILEVARFIVYSVLRKPNVNARFVDNFILSKQMPPYFIWMQLNGAPPETNRT